MKYFFTLEDWACNTSFHQPHEEVYILSIHDLHRVGMRVTTRHRRNPTSRAIQQNLGRQYHKFQTGIVSDYQPTWQDVTKVVIDFH